jgi:hypothetical protein
MFDTWVHATNFTFDESSGFRFSGVSFNPSSLDDSHHFTVSLSRSAMNSQGLTYYFVAFVEFERAGKIHEELSG